MRRKEIRGMNADTDKEVKTLILGHIRNQYPINNIRCSPIDVNLWYNKPYHCVDCIVDEGDDVDFVYDLYNGKFVSKGEEASFKGKPRSGKQIRWIWSFAKDNSYDMIVDCMGCIYVRKEYMCQDDLLETIIRVLTIGGVFYSRIGQFTKIEEDSLIFEPNSDQYHFNKAIHRRNHPFWIVLS
jgi:hypothetical protein